VTDPGHVVDAILAIEAMRPQPDDGVEGFANPRVGTQEEALRRARDRSLVRGG